ncbi:LSU ribosomal protein L1p (L10Ae) [hydrothermal vent metagenome]|uniref:LSU ribosomal protein L1p (L10Ae) n=1 Tax=hydrothermal vent metagenome TaxID=652676 RepID=A0A3B0V9I3_9ZZZZ
MSKTGKIHKDNLAKVNSESLYHLDEGLALSLSCKREKMVESVDLALGLGVDPRHADQMIRSSVVLPHGTGKTERVLVFAKGDKEKEALEAGADFAGGDDLVAKIKGGWLEFDRTIATPDMMGTVGKIGRVLGPRGLMPNAKLGTVTFDVARVVKEIKSGKVDFKVDKAGIIHAMVGKTSFSAEALRENILSFIGKILQLKPSSAKGIYLKAISLSTTMGPGVKLDPVELKALLKAA